MFNDCLDEFFYWVSMVAAGLVAWTTNPMLPVYFNILSWVVNCGSTAPAKELKWDL